ncbi:hypothetical protein KEM52_003828, partial [Ascosphaera acerosa]
MAQYEAQGDASTEEPSHQQPEPALTSSHTQTVESSHDRPVSDDQADRKRQSQPAVNDVTSPLADHATEPKVVDQEAAAVGKSQEQDVSLNELIIQHNLAAQLAVEPLPEASEPEATEAPTQDKQVLEPVPKTAAGTTQVLSSTTLGSPTSSEGSGASRSASLPTVPYFAKPSSATTEATSTEEAARSTDMTSEIMKESTSRKIPSELFSSSDLNLDFNFDFDKG